MINIDSKLLEALQESTCFGIAHDETVPECKQCDVRSQCKAKTEGANIATPTKKKAPTPTPASTSTETKKSTKKDTKSAPKSDKPSTSKKEEPKKKATKKKSTSPTNPNMPDFKPMSLDELKALATERNVEWKEYGNDNITRMRLIMNLKKSY